MGDLMEITLDPQIRKNPEKVGQLIIQLAEDIESCKGNLSEIKNRGFFKKIFSNNTRDLADAMLKQNDTITLFLNIVQSLIVLNLNNTLILGGIQDELTKHEKGRGNFSNKYLSMAKEYLAQSIESSKKISDKLDKHGGAITTIEVNLKDKDMLDQEQSKLIDDLVKKYKLKEAIDREQSEQLENISADLQRNVETDVIQAAEIAEVKVHLKKKDDVDSRQEEILENLQTGAKQKKEIDAAQSNMIGKLEEKIHKLEVLIVEMEEKLHKKNYAPHFLVCLILTLVSLGMSGFLITQ